MYSVSSYMYSVSSYLFIFSQIIYIQSSYIYSVPSYIICIQSHLIYSVWSYLCSVNWYVFTHISYVFSSEEVAQKCFAKFLRTNTSGGCFCQFTFIFCEHVQGAVCHVENLIKVYSFLKQSEFMSYRIIFHKEIKQTKILSKRDISALVLFLYYSNDLVFGSTS